ncbi:MAG: histidine phosphatase family protein [Chloroflexi bacterium]|nr:histidine phosphatase family protein [Chloroflexota bacterium]
MTHLYLIRHAEYIYAEQDGKKRDLGLSPDGLRQAERLRDRLAHSHEIQPDVLIVSTERGAQETAQILAPAFDAPMIAEAAVEEWRSEDGSFSTEEFMERWHQLPETQKPFYRWIEGYENWIEFSARAQIALNRIVQAHAGKTIVILTHGGVIQASFEYFFGYGLATMQRASLTMKNTSITHWLQPEGSSKWVLERFNDYHHL